MLPLVGITTEALPGLELQWLTGFLVHMLLSSIRMGAFLLSAPAFGARWLPLQIRIMMAFMLIAIIIFRVPPVGIANMGMLEVLIVIMAEVAVGLTAGLTLTVWFSAALLAGEKIATSAGLGFAAQLDPQTGAQTPVVSQMLYLFLTVIFFSVDGHLMVLGMMLLSYDILPVGTIPSIPVLLQSVIQAAGAMFFAATLIMMPVVVVLMMVNASIGVITRSAPQLNLFSFGFPISMLAAFFILFLSAGALGEASSNLISAAINSLEDLIEGLAHG